MSDDQDAIIDSIIQEHPEERWLQECRIALPDATDGYILSVIEILNNGDLQAVS